MAVHPLLRKSWPMFVAATLALMGGVVGSVGHAEGPAYRLPSDAPSSKHPSLVEISKSVAAVAGDAKKALVTVSTVKNPSGTADQFQLSDPFDFFFGPGNGGPQGFGMPRGGRRAIPNQRSEGIGSGFLVDLDQGYVITNNHVVDGADTISLRLANHEAVSAKVVGRDKRTDVAVVKINDSDYRKDGLASLVLADSTKADVGDFVVALGAPFGLDASVSFGVISATGRGSLGITELGDFIQTDAAINPGNSGGPLLDAGGQVIGMNTAIYSRSGAYAGIGFAVPANIVRRIAEELIAGGKVQRGYLGVKLQHLDPEMAEGLQLRAGATGALVAAVEPGTPADRSGIKVGDVVTAVDGVDVASENEVTTRIGLMRPGTSTKLTLSREGKSVTVTADLAEYPDSDRLAKSGGLGSLGGRKGGYGLHLDALSKDLAERYELSSSAGALVVGVEPDSAASRGGLAEGDLIVQANGTAIKSPEDFTSKVNGKGRVLLRVERAGDFFFVSLRANGGEG